ncbi:polysaccharide biosynthesis/export family protein [Phenylobacterium sp. VNQ135]|uniref:polysaccharide biosynthesis/export family protein n=1 Tax=Phenylobacterium sp. VNQ135 TaxID=3400922 RepID=UPI003C1116BF
MRRQLLSIAAAAFLVAAPPALAAKNSLPAPDSAALLAPAAADYRIGAQDVLEVNVFGIEDLKREVQVDNGGNVSLPLVGAMKAGGRTPGEFSEDVEKALKAKYMKDPQVIVTVKNAQSQRVTIDGAVNKPGVYPLSGPTTLLQAISLGGGPDQKLANVKKVAVFRQVGGKRHAATFNLNEIRAGKTDDPQIYGNDIVVVDTSGGSKFIQNFQGVFPLLGFLAW